MKIFGLPLGTVLVLAVLGAIAYHMFHVSQGNLAGPPHKARPGPGGKQPVGQGMGF